MSDISSVEESNSAPNPAPETDAPTREQILVHVNGVLEIPQGERDVLDTRIVRSVRGLMKLQRTQLEYFRRSHRTSYVCMWSQYSYSRNG